MRYQVTQEAAIEAAAKIIALSTHRITEADWGRGHLPKDDYYRTACLALEAAAPHMLMEAWDDGHSAGVDHADGLWSPDNPYRTTK
jgi:hypothetical protein